MGFIKFLSFLKSKIFFIQLGIALVVFISLIMGLRWWLHTTTNHDQRIEVPNLHKLPLDKVATKLQELQLDYVVIDSASYNPNYPKKSVIEQTPEAGDFVKEKRKIYLTINPSRYRDVTVPDVLGKTKRQATTKLQSIGFKIGKFTYVRDLGKDVVRGILYKREKVNPGTKLPKSTTLDLILGDGNR